LTARKEFSHGVHRQALSEAGMTERSHMASGVTDQIAFAQSNGKLPVCIYSIQCRDHFLQACG
jgi:hypothetical protein